MTMVKICGITRMEDAQHAAAVGAEMLGFNFYAKSPRYIAPESAREIVASLPTRVECVGVFVNATLEEVRRVVAVSGVRAVQLHGDESPEYCQSLGEFNPVKAIRIADPGSVHDVARFSGMRILLDAASDGFGGSGSTFDWSLAKELREHTEFLILAGGLDATNVKAAIESVAPDAVDACSRLESSPGTKNHEQVAKFIALAQQANAHAARGK